MSRDKQIEEMARDIGEKQNGGWKFVEESIYTTDTTNEELAEHLVINKGYRKASEVAREIFAEIEKVRQLHTIGNIDGVTLNVRLYEIKKKYEKKYTEGEKDNG